MQPRLFELFFKHALPPQGVSVCSEWQYLQPRNFASQLGITEGSGKGLFVRGTIKSRNPCFDLELRVIVSGSFFRHGRWFRGGKKEGNEG